MPQSRASQHFLLLICKRLKRVGGPGIAATQLPEEYQAAMTDEEVLAEFRAAEALLEGHFVLSSGLHSDRYLQCARVLMDAARASRLAAALALKLPDKVKLRLGAVV